MCLFFKKYHHTSMPGGRENRVCHISNQPFCASKSPSRRTVPHSTMTLSIETGTGGDTVIQSTSPYESVCTDAVPLLTKCSLCSALAYPPLRYHPSQSQAPKFSTAAAAPSFSRPFHHPPRRLFPREAHESRSRPGQNESEPKKIPRHSPSGRGGSHSRHRNRPGATKTKTPRPQLSRTARSRVPSARPPPEETGRRRLARSGRVRRHPRARCR
jgi:hypothetical protein